MKGDAMERSAHWLRRSKHCGFPKHQIALCVTTERMYAPTGQRRAIDILGSWHALEWSGQPGSEKTQAVSQGYDSESFWRWIDSRMARRKHIWIWTFNAARNMSLLGFWHRLESGQWALSRADYNHDEQATDRTEEQARGLCVVSDPPTIVLSFKPGASGSIRWLDIRNLGLDREDDIASTSSDVSSVAEWMRDWARAVDVLRLGGLRQTAASQAWHGWRHSYLSCGVLVHDSDEATRLERDSVYPGRAEAYNIGMVHGSIHQFDASSHYPACASDGYTPCRLITCCRGSLSDARQAVARGYYAIARCRIRTAVPLLPCRIGGDGKPAGSGDTGLDGMAAGQGRTRTVWPIGEWTATLCWPEIQAALETGVHLSVAEYALYGKGMPFGEMLQGLYGHRRAFEAAGRSAEASACKLIANSLIGRLASHGRRWVSLRNSGPFEPWTVWYRKLVPGGPYYRHRAIGRHVQREERTQDTSESTPAIASWIYSVARMRLWNWILIAGQENVYYVDSDSIFTSAEGGGRLGMSGHVRKGIMGALRLQGVSNGIRISGIRDYETESRKVHAGFNSEERTSVDGNTGFYCRDTVEQAVYNRRMPSAELRLITLPTSKAYRHGTVLPNGRVEPLTVNG